MNKNLKEKESEIRIAKEQSYKLLIRNLRIRKEAKDAYETHNTAQIDSNQPR